MNQIHDFQEQLEFSHNAENLDLWEKIYNQAFPDLVSFSSLREDGYWQRQGVDRVVILSNGDPIYIDEKVRRKNYGDILLEYLSDVDREAPGWVCKPLKANYIAYAVLENRKCYMMPVIELQKAWKRKKTIWLSNYESKNALNKGWTTRSVPVPIPELYKEIVKCFIVRF